MTETSKHLTTEITILAILKIHYLNKVTKGKFAAQKCHPENGIPEMREYV